MKTKMKYAVATVGISFTRILTVAVIAKYLI